ncbi:MAG: hypothetical protein JXB10_04760 [Pirellulales bacterium]|nr:hypothetical protein [Pirellulales bacterium]
MSAPGRPMDWPKQWGRDARAALCVPSVPIIPSFAVSRTWQLLTIDTFNEFRNPESGCKNRNDHWARDQAVIGDEHGPADFPLPFFSKWPKKTLALLPRFAIIYVSIVSALWQPIRKTFPRVENMRPLKIACSKGTWHKEKTWKNAILLYNALPKRPEKTPSWGASRAFFDF